MAEKKRQFSREVKSLLYAFGDVPNPRQDTVKFVEDLMVDYLVQLAHDATKLGQYRGRVRTEDFLFALRKEPRKLARAKELLALDKELKRARQAFNISDFTGA